MVCSTSLCPRRCPSRRCSSIGGARANKELQKVSWFGRGSFPAPPDLDFLAAFEMAFGEPSSRFRSQSTGCLDGLRRFGARFPARPSGSAEPAAPVESHIGGIPERAAGSAEGAVVQRGADERPMDFPPTLEIKAFPEAMGTVLGLISSARKSVTFTCYTIDHPELLTILLDRLKAGATVRIPVDGTVIKGGTVKNERRFFEQLLAAPEVSRLEVGVFTAPKTRLPAKGPGFRQGFGAQLYAKCGIVDSVHFWTGSLNLTQNSGTFYEVATIGRGHPQQAEELSGVLGAWWGHCTPMTQLRLAARATKSPTDVLSPADVGLS